MTEIAHALEKASHNIKSFAASQGVGYKTMLRRFDFLKKQEDYSSAFSAPGNLITVRQLEIYEEVFGLQAAQHE